MADAIVFGTERELCPSGCGHTVGVHGNASDGCSYIGVSGWCDCRWFPKRDGAAYLLEHTVTRHFVDGTDNTVAFDLPETKGTR